MLAAVFLGGVAAFLILRAAVVPESFGELGHYRADALEENRMRPIRFSGQQACADCHPDVVEQRSKGRHSIVSCETCHGPLAAHAQDPAAVRPAALPARLCAGCHETDSAKPPKFPQVAAVEHAAGAECGSCHPPHQPKP
jgi:hypothetical protein